MAFIERLWNPSYRNLSHYQDIPIYYVIIECRNGNRAFPTLYEAYWHIKRNRASFHDITVCYYGNGSNEDSWETYLSDLIDKSFGENDNWGWSAGNSYSETEDSVREQLRAYNCEFDYKPSMCNKKSWKIGF
jgi:hypothetical protein